MGTYIYSFPPGTPKNCVQLFRRVFRDTIKAPEFVAEAKKGNFDIDRVAGEDLEKFFSGFFYRRLSAQKWAVGACLRATHRQASALSLIVCRGILSSGRLISEKEILITKEGVP